MNQDQQGVKGRKLEILKATFKALKQHGLPSLTYDLISQHGDVSRQLIRYHYQEPEDLMIAMCDYLAALYREGLIAGVMQAKGKDRLQIFLDFYFDLTTELRKPRDDQVYDALMSMAAGSPRIQENLRNQYSLLGQVLSHEFELQYPKLGAAGARELSYLLVVMMYGHWKMVATLGLSEEHKHIPREAMNRLIESYLARGSKLPADMPVWRQ